MTTIPESHKEDSLKLNPEEFYQLFEIKLVSGTRILMHSGPEVQWSPLDATEPWTFESALVHISNAGRNTGEKRIRPTLTLGNSLDVFHVPVAEGHLDNATVTRYKVKPANLAADPPVFEKSVWYIAQVPGLGEVITCQLRSLSDRQEGPIPTRQYLPPEFPSVTI